MIMVMSLTLLPTEKDHFKAKNNNLRNYLLAYWHPKSVDFLRVKVVTEARLKSSLFHCVYITCK